LIALLNGIRIRTVWDGSSSRKTGGFSQGFEPHKR
jgi:hypothetical protein